MKNNFKLNIKGSGLVQLMVTIGISSIVTVGMMKTFVWQHKENAMIRGKVEENDIHRQIQLYLMNPEICKKTLEEKTVSEGTSGLLLK